MLEWKNVSVTIGGKFILRNVSASLAPGHITALLGPNGSGKSTLLGCVAESVRYEGSILLDGQDIRSLPPRLRAARLSLQPQILPRPSMTVYELVSLGRTPYTGSMGILSSADRDAVKRAMERADVSFLSDRMLPTLSGGECQRVYLALMLAQEADCLLLDEPTAFMDSTARRELYRICRSLRMEGNTLLLTMHDINEALNVADDVLLLDGGRLIFAGTTEKLLGTNLIENLYGTARHRTESGLTVFL